MINLPKGFTLDTPSSSLVSSWEEFRALSFSQRRLWFLSQLPGVSEAYHIPLGLRWRGELSVVSLRGALDRIVERHASLRTSFRVVDGEPVQVVAASGGFVLEEEDLRGLEDGEARLQELAAREVERGFDLSAGPLVRITLRVAGQDSRPNRSLIRAAPSLTSVTPRSPAAPVKPSST